MGFEPTPLEILSFLPTASWAKGPFLMSYYAISFSDCKTIFSFCGILICIGRQCLYHMEYNMPKSRTWTDDQLIFAVKSFNSISGVLSQLSLKAAGGNYKTIENAVKRLQLSTSHWTGQGHLRGKSHNWAPIRAFQDILVEDSDYTSTFKLKHRLIKASLLPLYECSVCHVSSWQGNNLALQLDHINGKNNDHRLENLRLLCPNCHSQTDTFAGKNKRKRVGPEGIEPPVAISAAALEATVSAIPPRPQNQCNKCQRPIQKRSSRCTYCKNDEKIAWPSKEELEKLVWLTSCSKLSKQLGVSDKAIEKRCKKLGISKPPRGYWAKQH